MAGGDFGLSTSVSLIRRARAMESDAWDVLTRLYGPLIYGWARKTGLQSEDAADVLQTVFLSVWRGLSAFKLDRPDASFRGWLRIITTNAIRESWRHRGTLILPVTQAEGLAASSDSAILFSEEWDGTHDDMFSALTHQALELVRGTVDTRTWEAFWKSTLEEIPVIDVAETLGMSSAAVRQAKYRVLCRLRELLADR
ncbi:sigma-70 family RNA polymerase sigma factor [bacterium]|nr:sigma-70 family RNA polymerase sigma factor [bacterium]